MPVSDIIKKDVISVTPDCTIAKAAELMAREHVGDLVVARSSNGDRTPIGIVTDRDIVLKGVSEHVDLENTAVSDIMSDDLVTVQEDSGIYETIELISEEGVNRVPVVNAHGKLVGILTSNDLLELLMLELSRLTRVTDQQRQRERAQI